MKILFVTPTWPLPPYSGAKARMLSVLKAFEKFDTKVVVLFVDINIHIGELNNKEFSMPSEENIYYPFNAHNTVFRLKRAGLRFIHKYFRRFYTWLAVNIKQQGLREVNPLRYYDNGFWEKLNEIVKDKGIDTIWFNYALWGIYPLEDLKGVVTIVDTHDSLSQRYLIAKQKQLMPKGIYATSEEEHTWIKKFDRVVAIQANEMAAFEQMGAKKLYTVGHVIDLKKRKKKSNTFIVGFIGSLNLVNRASLEYIENNIIAIMRNNGSINFEFWVAGAVVPASKLADVKLPGLENIDDFFGEIDVLINPVFQGTGLKIKNIEALAYGVPVVTTPLGAEGLEDCMDAMIVSEQANELIEGIIKLATDKELYSDYSSAAHLAIDNYNKKQEDATKAALGLD